MTFPISEFEQYIDETILQRGFRYFEKGLVVNVDEVSPNEFESKVLGSDLYHVKLTIDNGLVTRQLCDCPYDMGPVCKHVVAVLFHIQQDELELAAAPKPKKKAKPRGRSVIKQVDDILSVLSPDELKSYVQNLAKEDASFRRELLSHFAHLNKNESITLYTQQIKDILRKAAGRDGFIYWNTAGKVGKEVYDLLSTAGQHAENGNLRTAMLISFAIMEQMTDALQYADDSNADIGGNIDAAHRLLQNLAQDENLKEAERTQLFDMALTAYESKVFDGWDWHLGMLELASVVVHSTDEVQRLSKLLDLALAHKSDYWADKAVLIKFKLVQKSEGDDAVRKFIEDNLENALIRREAIEMAIGAKNFDRAISLAEKGIELDNELKHGRVWDWYDMLLSIAQTQNHTDKVIEYARLLFLDSNNSSRPYYTILKERVKKERWSTFVDELIAEMTSSDRWYVQSKIAGVLVDEQRWSQLMDWLKTNFENRSIGLRSIANYEKHLAHLYSKELSGLYMTGITNMLKTNVGRNHYIEACRYIRRMKKLGDTQQVEQLILHLRQTYSNRPALMEELNGV